MQAAIKFYLDRKAFQRERQLYMESQLKAMMPATLAIEDNADGQCSTPYGYVFPPFVIIECGQSLDEWARQQQNKDFITIFQVCAPPPTPLLHATHSSHERRMDRRRSASGSTGGAACGRRATHSAAALRTSRSRQHGYPVTHDNLAAL